MYNYMQYITVIQYDSWTCNVFFTIFIKFIYAVINLGMKSKAYAEINSGMHVRGSKETVQPNGGFTLFFV